MPDIAFLENLNLYSTALFVASIVFLVFIVFSVRTILSHRKNLLINFSEADKVLKRHNELKYENSKLQVANSKLQKDNEDLEKKNKSLEQVSAEVQQAQQQLDNIGAQYDSKIKMLADIEQKIVQSDALREFIEKHKELELSALDDQIKKAEEKLQSVQNDLNKNQVSDILNDLFDIKAAKNNLEQAKNALNAEIARLKDSKRSLEDELKKAQNKFTSNEVGTQLNNSLNDFTKKLSQSISNSTSNLGKTLSELSDLNAKRNELQRENENLQKQKKDLEDNQKQLNRDIANLNDSKKSLENDLQKAQNKLNSREVDSQISNSLNDFTKKLSQSISSSASNLGKTVSEISDLNTQYTELKLKNRELEQLNDSLSKQILENQAKLHPQDTEALSDAAYKDLEETPASISDFKSAFDIKSRQAHFYSELDSLDDFKRFLSFNQLYYSIRTIKAFHTSLKVQNVNPLSVLAGVSGTGKTQLAIQYARFFGLYNEHVAVQPRWDSKDDLLGFYNFLEQRYQPTKLATSLYWFDKNLSQKEPAHPMMLVILDEMNLARVEYYFSEFLSKLELRNSSRATKSSANEQSSIILGTPNSKKKINVDFRNVLFVGTMNEDESTFSLSDKVLDRANVLHFGPPSKFGQDTQVLDKVPTTTLTSEQFAEWCHADPLPDVFQSRLNDHLNNLNDKLEKVGKGFGHRVNRSINEYVRLYPGELDSEERFNIALSDQLEMKIIPKLAGLELKEQSEACLDTVREILIALGDKPLIDSFNIAKDNFERDSMFIWHGVKRDSTEK